MTEHALDGIVVRVELDEVEAAAQGEVHHRDGAVGGVHRPDDVQVFGKRKLFALVRVLEVHLAVSVLQQEVQLAEHLGEIAAVDFVNHEEVLGIRLLECVVSGAKQRPVTQLESRLPVYEGGAEALHEVLVGVGRVELDERDSLIGTGEMTRQFLRDVGLARARRPLKDDLEFVFEEGLDVFEEVDV